MFARNAFLRPSILLALLLVGSPETDAQMSGQWIATGELRDARFLASGVRLNDAGDRWLVAGGRDFDANQNVFSVGSAEIYDPDRGTWRVTQSLNVARANHTLDLLPEALSTIAAGGIDDLSQPLGSCEIFDPADGDAGLWRSGPSLNRARSRHASIRLPDGRLYVFGGDQAGTAEVLESDPSAPSGYSWRELPNRLVQARSSFTATYLSAAGVILLAGGETPPVMGQTSILDSAEIFDPATESFRLLSARLSVPRSMHGAVELLDGRAFIACGMAKMDFWKSCEFFDPATELFSPAPDCMMAKADFGICRKDNGKVCMMGGYQGGGMDGMGGTPATLKACEMWDPASPDSMMMGPDMPTSRFQFPCTAYGMNIVIAAGRRVEGSVNEVYRTAYVCRMDSPLAAPSLLSPAEGATSSSAQVALDWSDVSDAASYDVQLSESAGLREPLVFLASPLESQATTSALANGTYYWRVRAIGADGKAGVWSAIGSILVDVPPNRAPVLDPIGARSVAENANLNFRVTASDPDGDAVTLSASGLPRGATFAPASGIFDWTPDFSQAGSYQVRFVAEDPSLAQDLEDVVITVANTNRPPVLQPIGNKETEEKQNLSFTIRADDPDGEAVTYSATGLPSGATLDPASGAFSWTPSSAQSGLYTVTFSATDPGSLSDSEAIEIRVRNVVRHEESSSSITYVKPWSTSSIPDGQPGSYKSSNKTGATATLSFSGTRVKWIAHRAANLGKAEVKIDGVLVATINLYASASAWRQVVFDSGSLASGSHSIEVRVTGQKDSASSGVAVSVDAFEVTE